MNDIKSIQKTLSHVIEKGIIPTAQLFISPQEEELLNFGIWYLLKANKKNKISELFISPNILFITPAFFNKTNTEYNFNSLFLEFLTSDSLDSRNLSQWIEFIKGENKQIQIGIEQAKQIIKFSNIKSDKNKFIFIWMTQTMNISCANKILKILEEPLGNTKFILLSNNSNYLLSTIKSRCQITRLNFNNGLFIQGINETYIVLFEKLFIKWVRTAFMITKKISSINDLIQWSQEAASLNQKKQCEFLSYTSEIMRISFTHNYTQKENPFKHSEFNFENFSKFITSSNIFGINKELSTARNAIERNGNSKIIFNDLSLKLSKMLLRA